MATQRVIIDTTIKSVGQFEVRGRGRLAWAVVNAPYIAFVVALSRPGAQLLVEGVRVEGFEVPRVSGAAEALGSFGVFEATMPPAAKEGAQVTVVLPGDPTAR